jgi:hypothetical protein
MTLKRSRGLQSLPSRLGPGVEYYPGERSTAVRAARKLFRRALSAREITGLTGAPEDAAVDVGICGGCLYLDMYQPTTFDYHAIYSLWAVEGRPIAMIDAFAVRRPWLRRRGLGLRIFCRHLYFARRLGVTQIRTLAGRGSGENGYYTWPRFGFNGPLPPAVQRRLPSDLRPARTVLHLMSSEPGRRWWQLQGGPIRVVFDMAEGSASWDAFRRYAGESPGEPLRPPSPRDRLEQG